MAKFVLVDKAPEELRKGEYVIYPATFMQQIEENASKAPRSGLIGSSHLRYIVGSIGEKYDHNLTAWTIKPHLYQGRKFSSNQELSDIVVEALRSEYPAIFEAYLDHEIKKRPDGTKLVYYIGRLGDTSPFFRNGVDMIEEKDVDTYLGLKPKKIVGKPAVTNQEAANGTTE